MYEGGGFFVIDIEDVEPVPITPELLDRIEGNGGERWYQNKRPRG